jgi:hypothetical protein
MGSLAAGVFQQLLGTAPGAEVAARVGRTETAVRVMRTRLGIPTAAGRRRTSRRCGGDRHSSRRAAVQSRTATRSRSCRSRRS